MARDKYKWGSRLLEPAIIVALVTGTMYFIGYIYYNSFFSRLSLPNRVLNLPTAIYLREALVYCLILVAFGLPSFLDAGKRPQTFLGALQGNLLILAYGVISIMYGLRTYSNWLDAILLLLVSIMIFSTFLTLSKHRISVAHSFYRSNWLIKFSAIGFAALTAFVFAAFCGDVHATRLIQGSLRNSMIISLKLKDGTFFQEGKELILIMHHDGNYYVVERQLKTPKYPSVYIISDNQIAVATIKRIE